MIRKRITFSLLIVLIEDVPCEEHAVYLFFSIGKKYVNL